MNTPLHIEEFIKLSGEFPVIDVRSPAEFKHGHIPGAYNIPLFDNEERAKVGTAYKQIGRQEAIKIGFELVGPKLSSFVKQVEKIVSEQSNNRTIEQSNNELPTADCSEQSYPNRVMESPKESFRTVILRNGVRIPSDQLPTVLIHCWRGGMRSANFAHLLNVYGYKTHTLVKGYKAYRNFVLKSFDAAKITNLCILGGETGSGKTEILKKIGENGEQIIDLEKLARHKGSAFGSLGEKPQPTQEQFENNLAHEWIKKTPLPNGEGQGVGLLWLEDESRSIGACQIPNPIWEKMKQAPIFRINIPKKLRIERLMNDYGNFSKEELANCIRKIEKRLGPQHVKHALEELEKGNLREAADIALTYYDKAYNYNHEKRNFKNVFVVGCENADATLNAKKVISFADSSLRAERSNLTDILH